MKKFHTGIRDLNFGGTVQVTFLGAVSNYQYGVLNMEVVVESVTFKRDGYAHTIEVSLVPLIGGKKRKKLPRLVWNKEKDTWFYDARHRTRRNGNTFEVSVLVTSVGMTKDERDIHMRKLGIDPYHP